MAGFFAFGSFVSVILMIASIALGFLGAEAHVMTALTAAFFTISAHCLIFGIFTGAGKDTRELVQDLHLDPVFVGQTKAFRKVTFPPALYCILLVLITAIMGGSLPTTQSVVMHWIHGGLALLTLAYNIKIFRLEYRCIRENALILKKVNFEAAQKTSEHPELAPQENFDSPEAVDGLGGYEWGQHVFALGKFLCFLGWNAWLPYLYMRFIMAMIRLEVWPFLSVSVLFLASGYFLRWRYRAFRSRMGISPKPASSPA